MDAVFLEEAIQVRVHEPAVGAQTDPRVRQEPAQRLEDGTHQFHGADVGSSVAGTNLAADHEAVLRDSHHDGVVHRLFVAPVEQRELLHAVGLGVITVYVERDRLRGVALDEAREPFHVRQTEAVEPERAAVQQPGQRRLAGEPVVSLGVHAVLVGRADEAHEVRVACEHRVVVGVLVAGGIRVGGLADQTDDRVDDEIRVPMIIDEPRCDLREPHPLVDLAHDREAGIGSDRLRVEHERGRGSHTVGELRAHGPSGRKRAPADLDCCVVLRTLCHRWPPVLYSVFL